MIFFLMSFNFSNIERTRNCIFGRSTNWDNLSQGQSDINASIYLLGLQKAFAVTLNFDYRGPLYMALIYEYKGRRWLQGEYYKFRLIAPLCH